MGAPPFWQANVVVENVDATCERVKSQIGVGPRSLDPVFRPVVRLCALCRKVSDTFSG